MVNKPVKIESFQTVGVFEKSKLTEKPIKNLSILSPRDIFAACQRKSYFETLTKT